MSKHSGHVQHWTGTFASGIAPERVSYRFDPEVDTIYETEKEIIKKYKTAKPKLDKETRRKEFKKSIENGILIAEKKIDKIHISRDENSLQYTKIVKRINSLKNLINATKILDDSEKKFYISKCVSLLLSIGINSEEEKIIDKNELLTIVQQISIHDYYRQLKSILHDSMLARELKNKDMKNKLIQKCENLISEIETATTISNEDKKKIKQTTKSYLIYLNDLKID